MDHLSHTLRACKIALLLIIGTSMIQFMASAKIVDQTVPSVLQNMDVTLVSLELMIMVLVYLLHQ
jgi:hypothetical protein